MANKAQKAQSNRERFLQQGAPTYYPSPYPQELIATGSGRPAPVQDVASTTDLTVASLVKHTAVLSLSVQRLQEQLLEAKKPSRYPWDCCLRCFKASCYYGCGGCFYVFLFLCVMAVGMMLSIAFGGGSTWAMHRLGMTQNGATGGGTIPLTTWLQNMKDQHAADQGRLPVTEVPVPPATTTSTGSSSSTTAGASTPAPPLSSGSHSPLPSPPNPRREL